MTICPLTESIAEFIVLDALKVSPIVSRHSEYSNNLSTYITHARALSLHPPPVIQLQRRLFSNFAFDGNKGSKLRDRHFKSPFCVRCRRFISRNELPI
jgi:hypothetical protein